MSLKDDSLIVRQWNGWRLLFQGTSLKVDTDKMVPIAKGKRLTKNQLRYTASNLRRMCKNLDPKSFWLFCITSNILEHGNTPTIYEDVPDYVIDDLLTNFRHYLNRPLQPDIRLMQSLSDVELQMIPEKNGLSRLMNMVMNSDISILALMIYHSHVEPVDLDTLKNVSDQILYSGIYTTLKICLKLEDDYHISRYIIKERNKLMER